ncbi:hypothetical protein [Streptomyces sp. NRRL B-1347]|uniref:hypothetical protein n=1 Tax=Streptomyces sp. NRRL B-1347 TaxID=1476877 RepID=UPI00068D636D|nr:hypothetical protein [Streptomyces sp. NRRL B-1347]
MVPPTPTAAPPPVAAPPPAAPPTPLAPPSPLSLATPPTPAYAPVPAAPSPVGAFLGRTARGDWAGSAQAALWPLAALLLSALACAVPKYGQDDEDFVGFGDRLRIALGFVLQAVGGSLEFSGSEESSSLDGSSTETAVDGTFAVHLVPLTVTALFIGALVVGARILRNRLRLRGQSLPGGTAGLEAAVRVGLLTALGVLVLALFGQPEIQRVEVSSGPLLAMLGALALSLGVCGAVLHRDGAAPWLAARPGAQVFTRALGASLRALAVVLVLSSVTAYLSVTQIDAFSGDSDVPGSDVSDDRVSPHLVALLLLPNLGLHALGLGWGAPLESEAGRGSRYGDDYESASFGLSKLGDLVNSGAVVGALALGLVCALVIALVGARRCARRGEQILAAGLSFGLILLLAAVGGLGVETSAERRGLGGETSSGSFDAGVSMPDLLLFGLLWVAGAVLVVAVFTARGSGVPPVPPGPPVGQAPPVPPGAAGPGGAPAAYAVPGPYDPSAAPTQGVLAAPPVPARRRGGRAGVWAVTLAVALLVGGGTTAGIVVWQDNRSTSDKAGENESAGTADDGSTGSEDDGENGPAVSHTGEPTQDRPTDPARPSEEESGGGETAGDAAVPPGSERVTDSKGFSFAAPEGWGSRAGDNPTQSTYAGANGAEHFQVGVIPDAGYTSYENLTNMEEHAEKDPDKSDYRRIRLEDNTFQGRAGAVWEYTYTDKSGRKIHAINQSYVTDDGTEYAIQLSWRAKVWSTAHGARTHRTALDTWQTTG